MSDSLRTQEAGQFIREFSLRLVIRIVAEGVHLINGWVSSTLDHQEKDKQKAVHNI